MRTTITAAIAVAIVVALLAIFLRFQPAGSGTVFRRGNEVIVRRSAVYLRPLRFEWQCRVPLVDGHLWFDDELIGISATRDEFPIHLRVRYEPPPSATDGNWCTSFAERVRATAGRTRPTVDDLLDRRREAGDRIAASIEADLRATKVDVKSISARIDLPSGFDRLRPISAIRATTARPVIFVGLDGADWELLDDYMSRGLMPNLQRLVRSGSGGILETELPPLSPLVWTTMMTGASPLDHGILDFTRFNPTTHEKEPITSDERRVPAIWNMLTWAGKQSAVFGLWATYAAEPVHGVNVSDRLFTFLYSEAERPPGVVDPPTRQAWAERAVSDAERSVDLQRLRGYLPTLTESEYATLAKNANPYADPPAALRRILIETEIYRRL